MEDQLLSPSSPSGSSKYYHILGVSRNASLPEVCNAYKTLITKWNPDKHSSNKDEAEAKCKTFDEAFTVISMNKAAEKEHALRIDIPKSPKSPSLDIPKTPTKKFDEGDLDISSPILISSTSDRVVPISTSAPSEFSRCSTRGSVTPTRGSSGPGTPTTPPTQDETAVLLKMASKRNSTPIVYSHSTTTLRRKPPPIHKSLLCSLEELCHGGVKKVTITRDVISHFGAIVQEEETLMIKVKPGWRRGTKIMFEGKGDERPGFLPADIVFVVEERSHNLYKREGSDLDLGVEVPLIQALTGCTITVPLLGGETMTLTINDILYPGYEKIIKGQGMPKQKKEGRRGNLRLKFLVEFPLDLSDEQRSELAIGFLSTCIDYRG